MPAAARYGAQTQRAVENFPISGIPIDRRLIRALALIKGAAATANASLRDVAVDRRPAAAIAEAAEEVAEGVWDAEFPVDVFQTGSGTSSNMNANEVIAVPGRPSDSASPERCTPTTTSTPRRARTTCSPPRCTWPWSSRSPTSSSPRSSTCAPRSPGRPAEFRSVVKSGRTHLMDATPVTLGQEMGGYAAQLARRGRAARSDAAAGRVSCPSAAPPSAPASTRPATFAPKVIATLVERTGLPLSEAPDHFAAQGARDGLVEASGELRAPGRRPHQDRQRPPVDGLGPPHRPGRDPPARPAAGVVDHAGQGEPGAVRGRHPGRRPR